MASGIEYTEETSNSQHECQRHTSPTDIPFSFINTNILMIFYMNNKEQVGNVSGILFWHDRD